MSQLKQRLSELFGERNLSVLLTPWRKFYWWNKTRISGLEQKRVIGKYLHENELARVELGSPKRPGMEDWLATDIGGDGDVKIDFTKPLPFPDGSVDRIYNSHIMEHFSYPDPMMPFLRECHRILKHGGEFSIAVPDAEIFIKGYFEPERFDKEKYCNWDVGLTYKTPIDYVNFVAYLGGEHKHLFDRRNLCTILEEAGFNEVEIRDFDPSIDRKFRQHESLYARAIKG